MRQPTACAECTGRKLSRRPFLNRNTPTGPVYVLSPFGQVLRRIALNPPPKSELAGVKVSHGHLVAQFLQYQKQDRPGILDVERYCYRILDLHTGNEIAEYWHGPDITGIFAFYSSDGFVLVSATPEGNLELLHLQP